MRPKGAVAEYHDLDADPFAEAGPRAAQEHMSLSYESAMSLEVNNPFQTGHHQVPQQLPLFGGDRFLNEEEVTNMPARTEGRMPLPEVLNMPARTQGRMPPMQVQQPVMHEGEGSGRVLGSSVAANLQDISPPPGLKLPITPKNAQKYWLDRGTSQKAKQEEERSEQQGTLIEERLKRQWMKEELRLKNIEEEIKRRSHQEEEDEKKRMIEEEMKRRSHEREGDMRKRSIEEETKRRSQEREEDIRRRNIEEEMRRKRREEEQTRRTRSGDESEEELKNLEQQLAARIEVRRKKEQEEAEK
jgi:hypothetical protein